jgi:hypothetical protein
MTSATRVIIATSFLVFFQCLSLGAQQKPSGSDQKSLAPIIAKQEGNVQQFWNAVLDSKREGVGFAKRLQLDSVKAVVGAIPGVKYAEFLLEMKRADESRSVGDYKLTASHIANAITKLSDVLGVIETATVELPADAFEAKIVLGQYRDALSNYLKAAQSLENLKQLEARRQSGDSNVIVKGMYYSEDGGQTWKLNDSAQDDGDAASAITIEELRLQAAQAQSDLNDAQQQYEVQISQDTYRSPGNADVIAPGTSAKTGVQSQEPSIYPQITTSSKWQSPRNYRCASGPCTLDQWQQENTSKANQCSGAGCTGSQIAGNNGQAPVPTRQSQKPPQPACQGNPQLGGYNSQPCFPSPQPTPVSGGDDPLSHAWLCQRLASIVQHDKNSLAACRAKDQLCIQMFQAAVQSDLKGFNSNNCDAKLLH